MNPRLVLVAIILASVCAAFFFTSWIGFGAILLASLGLIVHIILPDDADATKVALAVCATALGIYGAFANYSVNKESHSIAIVAVEATGQPTAPETLEKAQDLIRLCLLEPNSQTLDLAIELQDVLREPPAFAPFSWIWNSGSGRKDCKEEADALAKEWPEFKLRLDAIMK